MPRRIDYYLSIGSPWAYLGHGPLVDIARRHGASLAYKPVFLGSVFAETGGLPVPRRHPARQRYRTVELQRWRDRRDLSFNIRPKYWPFDANLVDRFIIAIGMSGVDADAFVRLAYAAVWEREMNVADEAVIRRLAAQAGLDGPALLGLARGEAAEEAYEQNFRDALASDVFGSPSYVLDGELFWGQDRLEFLEDALASNRLPYTAELA